MKISCESAGSCASTDAVMASAISLDVGDLSIIFRCGEPAAAESASCCCFGGTMFEGSMKPTFRAQRHHVLLAPPCSLALMICDGGRADRVLMRRVRLLCQAVEADAGDVQELFARLEHATVEDFGWPRLM